MCSSDSDVDKSRHQHYNKLTGKIKPWKYSYELTQNSFGMTSHKKELQWEPHREYLT